MKISVKTRYGIASMIFLSDFYESKEHITLLTISEKLNISKIYLEQVFASLKKSKLVFARKGSKGGYTLSKSPDDVSLFDIFDSLEPAIFDKTEAIFEKSSPSIEKVLQENVYMHINYILEESLKNIKLAQLVEDVNKLKTENSYMYYL